MDEPTGLIGDAPRFALRTAPYLSQLQTWPAEGRVILAQFDDERVVVYQAYRPGIASFAVRDAQFGRGGFSLTRMSWIKPGFLWMMYRSGWASKEHQERVLAVSLKREAFDEILSQAVESTFNPRRFESPEAWKAAVDASSVRIQWDPDHDPSGAPVSRRAVQLGLRAETLARYAREWILNIEDITPFVHAQAEVVRSGDLASLAIPLETAYPASPEAVQTFGIDAG